MKKPSRAALLWGLSFLITLSSALYQRYTGPTYPLRGKVELGGEARRYKLPRSHSGDDNQEVILKAGDPAITGALEWKRFKTGDAWTRSPMTNEAGLLRAELPGQPAAGKLEYRLWLQEGGRELQVPADGKPVVIRFKGVVPAFVLVPHILCMFAAMMLAARSGLEVFRRQPRFGKLVGWTMGTLAAGGLVLGPIVQKYAFDAYWTGWPFGYDLTDNKTAIAFAAWLLAAVALKKAAKPARWVALASVVTFGIYLIPHSMFGSELDYAKLDQGQVQVNTGR